MSGNNQAPKANVIVEDDARDKLEAIKKDVIAQLIIEAEKIAKERDPNKPIVTDKDVDKAFENIQKFGKLKTTSL